MKHLISILFLCTLSMEALADCRDAYERASRMRDIRNGVIAVGTGAAAMVVAPTLFPTATIIFVGKYTLTVMGTTSVPALQMMGANIYKNNFDKLLLAFEAAKRNANNKHLNKIINKAIEKSGLEATPELEEKARELIAEGFEDETFYPVIGVRRNGSEKQSVFHRSAIVDYLSVNLSRADNSIPRSNIQI